jgi:hypothetical protein
MNNRAKKFKNIANFFEGTKIKTLLLLLLLLFNL